MKSVLLSCGYQAAVIHCSHILFTIYFVQLFIVIINDECHMLR